MTKKQTNKLMTVLINIATVLIIIGALSKLEHWPYGGQILWAGLISSFVLSGIEINRLKKIIKKLESTAVRED
jgi:hypothetical protein